MSWTIADLRAAAQLEKKGWLLDQIIPARGVTLVAGDAMAGKTSLLVSLSMAMAAGRDLAGHSVQAGSAYWVAADHPHSDLIGYIDAAAAGMGIQGPDALAMHFEPGWPVWLLDDMAKVACLRAELDQLGTNLVVLDSFRRLTQVDDSSARDVASVIEAAKSLTGGNRRAVVVVHHLRQDGGIRGSTDFPAATQSTVKLSKSGLGVVLVKAHHHSAPPTEWRIAIDHQDGVMRVRDLDAGTSVDQGGSNASGPDLAAAIRFVLEEAAIDDGEPALSREKLEKRVREHLKAGGHGSGHAAIRAAIDAGIASRWLREEEGPRRAKLVSLAV